MKRSEALAYRIHAQQLDRPGTARPITDAAVFDFGVQDTGPDGASWALANRGVPVGNTAELEASSEVALAWTLRAAPHYYRRTDLPEVLIATSPLSDRDAAKRVVGADKPLKEAGIPTLEGLTEVAIQMRHVVAGPMVKGEVSTRLTGRLDAPYLRYCGSCKLPILGRCRSVSAPCTRGWNWSPAPHRRCCVPFQTGRSVRLDPRRIRWPRLNRCNRSVTTSDFSARQRRMMSQPSWIRRSPRSKSIGRRMRSRCSWMAERVGCSVRRATSNKIKSCFGCSMASICFCRARIEI